MGIIKELDYNTVVKIAAGEVIDRPASIIRELIDNAIDAGADDIRIHIENGGKTYIEVQDNGQGMDRADLELCIRNHSTSKIRAFDDISQLNSLGFRGEALSSIAEVSDLTIRSCTAQALCGHLIHVHYGAAEAVTEMAMSQGTTIIVRDLFKQMPAREKFLGRDATETRNIDSEIIKKALAYPHISFSLTVGPKKKYASSQKNTFLERINDFYPDATSYFIPIEYSGEDFQAFGFLTQPAFLRPNRMYQYFFVNGRAVEWKSFSFAVHNAYANLIPRGNFPAVFFFMEIDPEKVDFNVHPMKKEVRFKEEYKLSRSVQHILAESLHSDSGISSADDAVIHFNPFEQRLSSALGEYAARDIGPAQPLAQHPTQSPAIPADDLYTLPRAEVRQENILEYRFRAIVFSTFIIMEGEDKMVFVDQHAAHERINYERLRAKYRGGLFSSQELLVPLHIEVPLEIVTELENNLDVLLAMGFEVEAFGGNSFMIRSIPEYIDYHDAGAVVMGFVEALDEDRSGDLHSADFIDNAIKQMSCKSSIRSGDHIQEAEVRSLLEELLKTEHPFSCPHGRPIMFSLNRHDIEKQFKRLGF